MTYSAPFLDQVHIKNNMGKVISNEKSLGLLIYHYACHAPKKSNVQELRNEKGPKKGRYLSKFPYHELSVRIPIQKTLLLRQKKSKEPGDGINP